MFVNDQEFEDFLAAFESLCLPKPRWTHHAHLAVALWYVRRETPAQALQVVRRNIRAYNASVGTINDDHNGYHETLTQLYLRGVRAYTQQHAQAPLLDSLTALLKSPMARSDWPLKFYSKDRLFSVAARRDWIEPDLVQGDAIGSYSPLHTDSDAAAGDAHAAGPRLNRL